MPTGGETCIRLLSVRPHRSGPRIDLGRSRDRSDRAVPGAFQRRRHAGIARRRLRRVAGQDAGQKGSAERVPGPGRVHRLAPVGRDAHPHVRRRRDKPPARPSSARTTFGPKPQVKIQHRIRVGQPGQDLHVLHPRQGVVRLRPSPRASPRRRAPAATAADGNWYHRQPSRRAPRATSIAANTASHAAMRNALADAGDIEDPRRRDRRFRHVRRRVHRRGRIRCGSAGSDAPPRHA